MEKRLRTWNISEKGYYCINLTQNEFQTWEKSGKESYFTMTMTAILQDGTAIPNMYAPYSAPYHVRSKTG